MDPSIEQIFRGPNEKRISVAEGKLNPDTENNENSARSELVEKRVRTKRENAAKRSNPKTNDATKPEIKRSVTKKTGKTSERIDRSPREMPKLGEKESLDYEAAADRDKSEYLDEIDDESVASAGNKISAYRGEEDSDKFIDQDDRSSLYDDFETKDVAKRGIFGAEDYEEEVDDDSIGAVEETAALDERESLDAEAGKKKLHGDVRVKREHETAKVLENAETSGKEGSNAKRSSVSAKDTEVVLKDTKSEKEVPVVEDRAKQKDTDEQSDQSKRNTVEQPENEASKVNIDSKQSLNDRAELETRENPKSLTAEVTGDKKTQEEGLSSDKQPANDPSSLEGPSKLDETKIAEVSNPEATKIEALPASSAEARVFDDSGKPDTSVNSEIASNEQPDGDYAKRVEEQIQRKIDSIKEEIKREIAENERIKSIEENNAKFDELRDRDEEEEDESAIEAERPEKRENTAKRSPRNPSKPRMRNEAEKRSIKRNKRQNVVPGNARTKIRSAVEASSNIEKRLPVGAFKKRSEQPASAKKRELPHQVYLVRNDRDTRKKGRRRSSRNSQNPEDQSSYKQNLPADVAWDLKSRGDLGDGKVKD